MDDPGTGAGRPDGIYFPGGPVPRPRPGSKGGR